MEFFLGLLTAIADWGANVRGGPGASAGYCLELPGWLIFPFKSKQAPCEHRTRVQPCPKQVVVNPPPFKLVNGDAVCGQDKTIS